MPEDSGRRDMRNRPSKDGTQSVTRMLAWAEALHDNTALARRIQATSWTNDPRSSADRARTPEDNACRHQQRATCHSAVRRNFLAAKRLVLPPRRTDDMTGPCASKRCTNKNGTGAPC